MNIRRNVLAYLSEPKRDFISAFQLGIQLACSTQHRARAVIRCIVELGPRSF